MGRPRSPKTVVAGLFDAASLPIYLLDSQRRIVYCNAALAKGLQRERDELLGLRCDYHCGIGLGDEHSVVAGLGPPPDLPEGRRCSGEVAFPLADGEVEIRRVSFTPLFAEGELRGTLGVVDDHVDPSAETTGDDAHTAHRLLLRIRQQQGAAFHLERFIGRSSQIRAARDRMMVAAQSRGKLLVVGPSGSGREHVARTVHEMRDMRKVVPLTLLACALLDAELLQTTVESLLKRGAELADEQPGAMLLLEVDQLTLDAQAALVGLLAMTELDLQLLATARRPLLELAAEGTFREDLAYGLSTVVIELPPLSDRKMDIPVLAQYAVEQHNVQGGRQLSGLTPEAIDMLLAYGWPHNVDELLEAVSQACQAATGTAITAADLPKRIHLAADASKYPYENVPNINLDEFLIEIEAELINRAMAKADRNKAEAARLLGVNRARLLRRLAFFQSPPGPENGKERG